ncbi:MAG: heavy metal translocating P-type ATPase [Desulfovibrio sp.]|nr:heavy metal translocating P-type ATPase [Desulfovibrio sp.]
MANEKKVFFDISGMTCAACSGRVHKAVAALAGVADVNVNLLKNTLTAGFDPSATSTDKIVAAVAKAGYGATLRGAQGTDGAGKERPDAVLLEIGETKLRLIVSFLFTLPLFYLSMGHMLKLPLPDFLLGPKNMAAAAFSQFLLTVPVLFVNFRYYRTGFKTLFAGAPNMDSLIAIGSGAATVFGVYSLYKMFFALGRADMATAHHFAANLYFESAAMILTLITLGKFFEARAKGRTTDAIAKLVDLVPATATVLRDGLEEVVAREDVRVGDILVVKAGENVPVDGAIIEGNGFLDESAISGESLPLEKGEGDPVTGATINASGHFLMRADRIGDDTTLARIIRLVDEATSSKAPIARLADKISGIFVPVVMGIALLATAVWLLLGYDPEFALSIGISVLVISCPCALGLATPTAIMVGAGRGAADGILFKSAQAIEIAQSVDTMVLDKTGTVTEGKPVLTDLIAAVSGAEGELLALAASLEKLSEHPLGAAILREAEKQGVQIRKVTDFTQNPGLGIAGTLDGIPCLAGNAKLLKSKNVSADEELLLQGEALAAAGKTPLYFARGNKALGLIAVADVIKTSSRQAVAELRAMGIEVVMLTGDNAGTAAAIQRQAGIPQVIAEALPEDKAHAIHDLRTQGKKVAMVGDGINDAPALVQADVGIAIGAGADIAIEAADIVLMKSDLLDAVKAIQLSRAVMRTIRQNLFWAFFYNSVGIPVAAGVFYGLWGLTLNPMIAAAAMSLSSVSVVANALRLRMFVPKLRQSSKDKGGGAEDVLCAAAYSGAAATMSTGKRSCDMQKRIRIEGMNCGHCTASVEKALRALPGVTDANVDLASKTAVVRTNEKASDEDLQKAVIGAGFAVVGIDPA